MTNTDGEGTSRQVGTDVQKSQRVHQDSGVLLIPGDVICDDMQNVQQMEKIPLFLQMVADMQLHYSEMEDSRQGQMENALIPTNAKVFACPQQNVNTFNQNIWLVLFS